MRIGKNLSLKEIWDQGYKAVLLASGAWQSIELKIPGVDLKGICQALNFLKEVKLGEKKFLKGKVVVIGGGNVAVDAARTALRLGSEEVTLACLESRPEMPAFPWEIEKAEGEGVKILCTTKDPPKTLGKVKEVGLPGSPA
jgi:NADPH-dependent glutamate synthase beta subunit-like oxidoreductase